VLFGYGIKVRMQGGHLEVEDGIGPERRRLRFARVGHGLKRLVIIGSDGFISLAALQSQNRLIVGPGVGEGAFCRRYTLTRQTTTG